MKHPTAGRAFLAALAAAAPIAAAAQPGSGTVYRCPGNPVLYTDQLSAKEAIAKGCRTIEGAPITIVETPRPRPTTSPPARPGGSASPPGSRIDPADQRARDGERRSILQAELNREEARLADLRREYNDGQPERLGSERNYQKYLDRVEELKAGIARKENDIASIRRELGKLPP